MVLKFHELKYHKKNFKIFLSTFFQKTRVFGTRISRQTQVSKKIVDPIYFQNNSILLTFLENSGNGPFWPFSIVLLCGL